MLVVLLEGVALPAFRTYYYDAYTIMLADKRETMYSANPDVVIFGSSRAHHIDPEVVASALPGNPDVENFSWGWCGVEVYYGMLRTLISAGKPPKTIIVDSWPELMTYPEVALSVVDNRHFKNGFSQTVPTLHGLYTLLRHHLAEEAWDVGTIYFTPPSARYRDWLLPQLNNVLTTGTWTYPPHNYDYIVQHSRDNGWFLCVPEEQVAPESVYKDIEASLNPPLTVQENRRVRKAYERFIRLAEDHDIQVVMVPVPTNPYFYKIFETNGAFNAYDEWLDKLERRYSNFKAVGPRYITGDGIMGDPWHVNKAGADYHMKILAESLRNAF